MKIFLRQLSDPGFQNSVGEELGVHRNIVCKAYTSVMDAVFEKASIFIKCPKSAEAVVEAKQLWQQVHTFPAAIGFLNCTHVRISMPTQFGDEYINRKYFASISVQARCNAQENFQESDSK
nr:unnamed protein product [Callosobruchus analis]